MGAADTTGRGLSRASSVEQLSLTQCVPAAVQRGIDPEQAVSIIISGFCADVFNKLPDEFAEEVNALMSLKLEGSVG